jgi:hypothetical protein
MPKGVYKRKKRAKAAKLADYFGGIGKDLGEDGDSVSAYKPYEPEAQPTLVGALEEFERQTQDYWTAFGAQVVADVRRRVFGE